MVRVLPSISVHATTVNPPIPYESPSFVLPIPKPVCTRLATGSFFVPGLQLLFSRSSTILYEIRPKSKSLSLKTYPWTFPHPGGIPTLERKKVDKKIRIRYMVYENWANIGFLLAPSGFT
jgi:hypothetical protein